MAVVLGEAESPLPCLHLLVVPMKSSVCSGNRSDFTISISDPDSGCL